MEKMSTYECAICGRVYDRLLDRIECETSCLAEEEKLKKKMDEDAKKKARQEAEAKINKKFDELIAQYNEIVHLIKDYYDNYEEDIYNRIVDLHIPKTVFDFFF